METRAFFRYLCAAARIFVEYLHGLKVIAFFMLDWLAVEFVITGFAFAAMQMSIAPIIIAEIRCKFLRKIVRKWTSGVEVSKRRPMG